MNRPFVVILAIACLQIGLSNGATSEETLVCPWSSVEWKRAWEFAQEAGCTTVYPYDCSGRALWSKIFSEMVSKVIESAICSPNAIGQVNTNKFCKCEHWKRMSCELYTKCLCCCSGTNVTDDGSDITNESAQIFHIFVT